MNREAGTLFVVATPIGNLEDITARALRVLGSVGLIAAEDTRRTAGLLAHYGIRTRTISFHDHNEVTRTPRLIERLQQGEDIAIVSDAGTPTVSDPGQRLIAAAIQSGIRVEPIPGPSAILTALAGSGFPADTFSFLGFPPTRSKDRIEWVIRLKSTTGVAVVFEAPHRILATLEDLKQALGAETPVVVSRELTKVHEEWVRGPISEVIKRIVAPRGEYVIVIDIGQTTDNSRADSSVGIDWLAELGHITETLRLSRRKAIAELARRTGRSPNEVYSEIERAKNRSDDRTD